jgi:hypothetical protein
MADESPAPNPPERKPTLQERFEAHAGVYVSALLAIVLFGLVNFISARHYRRLD